MWSRVDIAGRAADIFLPGAEPVEHAVIYLHGYAGESLRDNEVYTQLFQEHRLAVVCPQGGTCWWLDTPCVEFDKTTTPMQFITRDVVGWITQTWGVTFPRIALLGVSMGGQGALNLAYRNALRFQVVAALSPAIDFDQVYGKGFGVEALFESAEAARQETAVLHLHPLNWPRYQFFCSDPSDAFWHAGSERLASKLASSGVPFTSELKRSYGGHGWGYFNAMAETAMGFLKQSLKQIES